MTITIRMKTGNAAFTNPDAPEDDRAAQDDAIANPVPYDSETEQLLSWYQVETKRRGFKVAA